MRVENGYLIPEKKKCFQCQGTKRHNDFKTCPLIDKPVKHLDKSKCPYCGAKRKFEHKSILMGEIDCKYCEDGFVAETLYDYVPLEIWRDMEFRVFRSTRPTSVLEKLLGVGVFSSVDYGKHKELTDEQLIESVKGKTYQPQGVKIANTKTGKLADFVGIYTSEEGYSVIASIDISIESLITIG